MCKKLVVVLTSVVLFAAARVEALGLGDIILESDLNQPLSARIELLQLGTLQPNQISVQLASENDFARFSIDRESFLDTISFEVDSVGSSAFIRLTTYEAVREPYLSFVLETRWPSGRLLTEYTVLLDLPAFAANAAPAPVTQLAQSQNNSGNSNQNQLIDSQLLDNSLSSSAPLSSSNAATQSSDVVSASAASGEMVSIDANDTLWDIALEVRPDSSVSVQQTMLALQRLNTEAFIGGNINMIRRGQVLRIPDVEQMRALSVREAVNEVSRQNQLFENRRNVPLTAQPVAVPPGDTPVASQTRRGELSVLSVDSAQPADPAAGPVGQSAELDARIASLETALALQREEADRVALENAELRERLGLLEEQIAAAREIIRLRDIELAQLQQALADAQAAAPLASPPVIVMAPPRNFLQTVLDDLVSNTYALLAIAIALILGLVFFLQRRNKAAEQELSNGFEEISTVGQAAAPRSFSATSIGKATVQPAISATEPHFDEMSGLAEAADDRIKPAGYGLKPSSTASRNGHEAVLAEVDALIANARYAEAVSLLQDEIDVTPERVDLRIRLLEIYAVEQDAASFREQEAELSTFANASVLSAVAKLKTRLKFAPEESVYDHADEEFFTDLDLADSDFSPSGFEAQASVNQADELLDFDSRFARDELSEVSTDAAVAVSSQLDTEDPCFDLDASEGAQAVADLAIEASSDDFADLRFVSDSLAASETSSEQLEAKSRFVEDSDEDFEFFLEDDEVATKLDLARAYYEMGDHDGAREILEEVLKEGSEVQKQDARSLLQKF